MNIKITVEFTAPTDGSSDRIGQVTDRLHLLLQHAVYDDGGMDGGFEIVRIEPCQSEAE